MRPFWLYMIECGTGALYVGHTDDLERRWVEHVERWDPHCYTASRFPLRLVYAVELPTRAEALERELQIKRWSAPKKRALIAGDWPALKRLARPSTSPRPAGLGSARDERGGPNA